LKKSSLTTITNDDLAIYCEQFLVNSFYRLSCEAVDVGYERTVILACVFAWWIINSVCKNEWVLSGEFDVVSDIVREYSAEVEYSYKKYN
jgi:hypothetical protein